MNVSSKILASKHCTADAGAGIETHIVHVWLLKELRQTPSWGTRGDLTRKRGSEDKFAYFPFQETK